MRAEPVAITGLGLVSAAGTGVEALGSALQEGKSFLGPLRPEVARGLSMGEGGTAPVSGPDRARSAVLLAAREALESSSLLRKVETAPRIGVAIGTALGSIERGEAFLGGGQASELRSLPLHALADENASAHGLAGRRTTFSVTCLSSLHAVERALADLALGRADAMLVGGVDVLTRFMQAGFCSLDVLSRSGLVLGEAACFAVVEPLEKARARGSRIRGVVSGLGMSSDSTHLTSPDESGRGMERAIVAALEDAGLYPAEVRTVSVTARASAVYDRMYDNLLPRVFDGSVPRVTTWERAIGHVLAASGAVGLVHACLELERDPSSSPVLALNVGFGGQNGALVVEREPVDRSTARAKRESRPRGATIVGRGVATTASEDLESQFPGRWNAVKRFPDELRVLVQAVATATESAGWWRPGSGASLDGGLVVGVDLHSFGPAMRFGRSLEAAKASPADRRPSDFLFALPSSAAAAIGVLFGLQERQATITEGGLSGIEAVSHALDLLQLGKLERAVVAALTFVGPEVLPSLAAVGLARTEDGPFQLAVAWCLAREGNGPRIEECANDPGQEWSRIQRPATEADLSDVPEVYRGLAAPSLLSMERLLAGAKKGDTLRIFHDDPCRENTGPGFLEVEA